MRVRHRLLLVLSAVGLAGAALVALGALGLVRSTARQRTLERVGAETQLVAEWATGLPADGDAQAFAERTATRLGLRVSLIAADGRLVADSSFPGTRPLALDNHLGRPEMRAAQLGGVGEAVRRSDSTGETYYYCARVVPGSGSLRYVRLALPWSEVQRLEFGFVPPLLALVLGSTALLVGLGYAAVRRLSRPVEQLADAVARAARATPAEPLPTPHTAGEEVVRLAHAVQDLQSALLAKIVDLDRERGLLSSVVAGMREGLLLVGADGRVELANDALRTVLDLAFDPIGHRFEEVVRHPAVVREIDAALSRGTGGDVRVRLPASDRAFEIRVAALGGAALVLFFDVTRLESLEQVRRDFVADVSHELRTPLTSIKAFVENLLDGGLDDPRHTRQFLEIVRRHSDRMGALIEDLTDLSLIETGAVALEPRTVELGDVARGVLEPLRPLAVARGVETEVALDGPFPLRADRRRLEQMLANLLDNAIKFNRPGGRVVVRGERGPAGPVVVVEDTGIGIAADQLEKVFQRFYQANRHRSRELGGTGLGLSIVKHLMRLHGGRVRVASELGSGSTFRLEFPPEPAVAGPQSVLRADTAGSGPNRS